MVVRNPNSLITVLLAEDNAELRTFIAALLDKSGYKLVIAKDGREALQKAAEFEGTIDLLLSDIEMPGMTGIELAIQIKLVRAHTKILLISNLASGLLVLNNGWQFLPKPFLGDMLRDRVRDFLREQPEENQPEKVSV